MSNDNKGIFIGDIPFFEDYYLWLRCKKEARKRGIKPRYFIVQNVQEYLSSIDNKVTANTPERLFDACELRARQDNASIAAIIERACAAKMGVVYKDTVNTPQAQQPKSKGSFFDLNRDADKK